MGLIEAANGRTSCGSQKHRDKPLKFVLVEKDICSQLADEFDHHRHDSTRSTKSLSRQQRVSSADQLPHAFSMSSSIASLADGASADLNALPTTPISYHDIATSETKAAKTEDTDQENAATENANEPRGVIRRTTWLLTGRGSGAAAERERHRSLMAVGKTLQRTGSQIKTKRGNLLYCFLLSLYTFGGAYLFQYLDGEHDDRLLREYKMRCGSETRNEELMSLRLAHCSHKQNSNDSLLCFQKMRDYLREVENCYRKWHSANKTITHSLSDFKNALVYAFSVYSTIGYGNMAADTVACRTATIVYGIIGIPLFFAFVKEAGIYFRQIFISIFNRLAAWCKHNCCERRSLISLEVDRQSNSTSRENSGSPTTIERSNEHPVITICELESQKRARFMRRLSSASMFGKLQLSEQRRVFAAALLVLTLYMLLCSLALSLSTEFDFFTSLYFLFNSVALIGFGDIFPANPSVVLYHAIFIIIGVVLFSMCYFILQEEIRSKASEASRKARKSISKYSQAVLQQARGQWSRRNSPLLEDSAENMSAFEKLKRRRQSAPAVTLAVPSHSGRKHSGEC